MVTFLGPWWLLALPVAWAVVVAAARWGTRNVPAGQHRWATALRLGGVSALVLALAHPVVLLPIDERTVLFLLDHSASVSPEARRAQDSFVARALLAARARDASGVAVFGAETRTEAVPARERIPGPVRASVDGSATDLAGALRAGAALLPAEGSRRIVVLTDGVETTGDARQAAEELGRLGVAVDVVLLSSGRGPDALVERVVAPATVREGEVVPVRAVVRSNTASPARVTLRLGDGETTRTSAMLHEGRNEVAFEVPAGVPGVLRLEVTVEAEGDRHPENDRAEALVAVLGPARVAMIEGRPGEGEELARALEAGDLLVDRLSSIPSEVALLDYDAVVLVDVAAPGEADARRLGAFVEELGRGLVVVGGERSYGLGGYGDSSLEDVLPVRSHPDDLVRRQRVAEVLVIDVSGSMSSCHCREGEFLEGGVNKTDISRAGAALAIEALRPADRVGVLAFASSSRWVIPLGPKPSPDEARSALATLTPDGDTEIAQALRAALDELQGAEEELRHIVLFTDGWDPDETQLLPVSREIAGAGVTLSVLATGEGPGSTLRRMADVGRGRYYPGTDLEAIPEVFVDETLAVARPLVSEGDFSPVLGPGSAVTAGLEAAPPLRGYVVTQAKAAARVPMLVGDADDPLLASWQRGLGRVTAWTSDATSRWSADWVAWEGFAPFWGRVVRDVMPESREAPPEVRVSGGLLEVSFEAPGAALDANALARVRGPEGEVTVLPLDRTSASSFEGELRLDGPGAHWVAVTVSGPDGPFATGAAGAVSSYPDEFAFRDPDPGLAPALASLTGGRVDPEPPRAFDPAPTRGRAGRPAAPWLIGLALATFLGDVALRRLVLTSEDDGVPAAGPSS